MNLLGAPVAIGTPADSLVCVPIALTCSTRCEKCSIHMPGFYRVAIALSSRSEEDVALAHRLRRTSFIFGKVLCAN